MSEKSISFDSMLGLCRHQHRRIVLETLTKEQQSVPLDGLTAAILEQDRQEPPTDESADARKAVRVRLIQIHLPKLADAGLITHDSDRDAVELTEQFDQVQSTLSTILDADSSFDAPIQT